MPLQQMSTPGCEVILRPCLSARAQTCEQSVGSRRCCVESRVGRGPRAFQRVKAEEWLDKKGAWDNSYGATFGSDGWGAGAQAILGQVSTPVVNMTSSLTCAACAPLLTLCVQSLSHVSSFMDVTFLPAALPTCLLIRQECSTSDQHQGSSAGYCVLMFRLFITWHPS